MLSSAQAVMYSQAATETAVCPNAQPHTS